MLHRLGPSHAAATRDLNAAREHSREPSLGEVFLSSFSRTRRAPGTLADFCAWFGITDAAALDALSLSALECHPLWDRHALRPAGPELRDGSWSYGLGVIETRGALQRTDSASGKAASVRAAAFAALINLWELAALRSAKSVPPVSPAPSKPPLTSQEWRTERYFSTRTYAMPGNAKDFAQWLGLPSPAAFDALTSDELFHLEGLTPLGIRPAGGNVSWGEVKFEWAAVRTGTGREEIFLGSNPTSYLIAAKEALVLMWELQTRRLRQS